MRFWQWKHRFGVVFALGALVALGCDSDPNRVGSDAGQNPGQGQMAGDGAAIADGAVDGAFDAGAGAMDGATADAVAGDGALPDGSTGGTAGCPVVPVTFAASGQTCERPTRCGGNPVGSRCFKSGCIDDPFPGLATVCPSATLSDLEGSVSGRVTFTDNQVQREVSGRLGGNVRIPASCAPLGCEALASAINVFSNAGYRASCTSAVGGCACALTYALQSIPAGTTYTTANGVLLVSTRRYDYCVAGGAVRYQESSLAATEPGVWTLE